MKKLLFTAAVCAALAGGLSAAAEIGDVVGYVYSTDILATVNSVPIPSYSLDGKTAIALRDLENYGFNVTYDDSVRVALVDFAPWGINPIEGVERGTVGEIVGEVLETDIVAYINGEYVPTHNIGGHLVAAIEDIAPWGDGSEFAAYGYAKTGMTYTWDEESRTVDLITLPAGNDNQAQEMAMQRRLELAINENGELVITTNKFANHYLTSGVGHYISWYSLNKGPVYPITYVHPDGTREDVGMFYGFRSVTWDENSGNMIQSDTFTDSIINFDMDKIEKILSAAEPELPTFEEEIEFWENGGTGIWRVTDRLDADDYSVLYMRQTGLPHGGADYQVVRIDRDTLENTILLTDIISAPELYGDELYYFRGLNLCRMSVFEGSEEIVCEATTENILDYIDEFWQTEYEYTGENVSEMLLSRNGDYRLYEISTSGINVAYRGVAEEAYYYEGENITGRIFVINDGRWYNSLTSGDDAAFIETLRTDGKKIGSTPYEDALLNLISADGNSWRTDDIFESEEYAVLYQTQEDGEPRLMRIDKESGEVVSLMQEEIECIGLKDDILSYSIAGGLEEIDVMTGETAALEESVAEYIKGNYEILYNYDGETTMVIYRYPGAVRMAVISPEGLYIHRGGFSELYVDGEMAAFKDGNGTSAYCADGVLIPGESEDFRESVYNSIVKNGEKII